jgi:hypothetical protein
MDEIMAMWLEFHRMVWHEHQERYCRRFYRWWLGLLIFICFATTGVFLGMEYGSGRAWVLFIDSICIVINVVNMSICVDRFTEYKRETKENHGLWKQAEARLYDMLQR